MASSNFATEMRKRNGDDPNHFFFQSPPRLGNQWLEDSALKEYFARVVPADQLAKIEPDLQRFGQEVVEEVWTYGKQCEKEIPVLHQYDGWGRRVDEIKTCNGWHKLKEIAAKEGIVATGYERGTKEYSRLHQYAKWYLFTPSSATFTCPLAMADGAARVAELARLRGEPWAELCIQKLTSRDPTKFWTSGQWMTERTGGSDISNTETVAFKQTDGSYRLYGFKYFTSATTSEMAIGLARIVDEDGKHITGSRGLSAFYIPMRKEDGEYNGIKIFRLKDKLGTKSVATAELELHNSKAMLIGEEGKGVPVISTLFNLTRIHNAISGCACIRRSLATARDYAHRRKASGKPLSQLSLHQKTLADMEITLRGCLFMTLDACVLLGKQETHVSNKSEDAVLRILTPLIKLYVGKQTMEQVSEGIEALGGTGYMEDASDLPALLRNMQVGTIWEGTTNVLSLDLLRAIQRNPEGITTFANCIKKKMSSDMKDIPDALASISDQINRNVETTILVLKDIISSANGSTQARSIAYSFASSYAAACLVEHALWSNKAQDVYIAKRWLEDKSVVVFPSIDANFIKSIALDEDLQGEPRGYGDRCAVTGKLRSKY